MFRSTSFRTFHRLFVMTCVASVACGGDDGANGAGGADTSQQAIVSDVSSSGPVAFTVADLDAYERGLAKEIELVRAAQQRQSTAKTPEERGAAMQAQWKEQTIPEGARSAGMPEDRYTRVRETVNDVLQILDFQGEIDGPMQIDTARASADMKRRLATDPLADLSPESAAALRARMDRLVPLWIQYVTLTAVGG
jgi:hypothetical protein